MDKLDSKRISAFLLASALCFCFPGIKAHAAENIQDGVKLSVTTDKPAYAAGDKIVAEISLENNSSNDITDISVEGTVPEGYHLEDGKSSVMRSTYIMSGNSIRSELVFIPDKTETETTEKETVTSTEAANDNVQKLTTATAVSQTSSTTGTSTAVSEEKSDKKGNSLPLVLGIIGGIAIPAAVAIVIILKKKGSKTGIMILLCITAAGALDPIQAKADEEDLTMSVTEEVTVDGETYELTATVKYTVQTEDMQAVVEEYYSNNSEEIVSVEEIQETEDVFSEKEVIEFLAGRGFTDYPVTYDYNMDGTYTDEAEASADSDEKHPMYQTYFVAEDGSVWSIFIVGRTIAANPASYNLESDNGAQVLVSETETLTSYTEMGNKLYTTIPKESAVILKIVDQITSQKLNDLTF
ncbi:MAG: hypothetical protein GXY08_08955 [Ruminococcus sp.]|nr:hypothetical protein [Ruminococcus sp.]